MRVERHQGHGEPAERALLEALCGLRALDPGVDVLGQTVQGPHRHPLRPRCARHEERVHGLGGAVGTRAAERIVELGEEHPLPGVGQLGADVGRIPGQQAAHLVEDLGRDECVLGPPVGQLEVGPGRVAADGMPLELPVHHREPRRASSPSASK